MASRFRTSFSVLFGMASAFAFFVSISVHAATFTVNSTATGTDGTCVHPFIDDASDCTWRDAVTAVNASAGADTILFDIDASFPKTSEDIWSIDVSGLTATFTETVSINASSLWNTASDRPGIALTNGASTGRVLKFDTAASDSKIQGLEISGGLTGILIGGNHVLVGTDCDGVLDARERNVIWGFAEKGISLAQAQASLVRGNYIGVKTDGLTASSGTYGIHISGVSSTDGVIGFSEGTSASCDPSVERNVIGGTGDSTGIYFSSSSSRFTVAGNYLGIGKDGLTPIAGGTGIVSTGNDGGSHVIGTDGDGVDDAFEGNIIGSWTGDGMSIQSQSFRISGNSIGFGADGNTARPLGGYGLYIRGGNTFIGWCDTATDPLRCSDAGSVETQRNIIGNSGLDGIRLGSGADGARVLGNLIGVTSSGVDAGNGGLGIFHHRRVDDVVIGDGSEDGGNTIRFNTQGGILVDAYTNAPTNPPTGPTENYTIKGNLISNNEQFGVSILGTALNATAVPNGTIRGNTIENNVGPGLLLQGSSPLVDSNTVSGNQGYGIEVVNTYADDGSGGIREDISVPTVTSNTISNNTTGGLYFLDTNPSNTETVGTDNTFSGNTDFHLRRDWYVLIDIAIPNVNLATETSLTVTLSPLRGGTCQGVCTGSVHPLSGHTYWAPSGFLLADQRTWFRIAEEAIDPTGIFISYTPYEVVLSQGYESILNAPLSIEGGSSSSVVTIPMQPLAVVLAPYLAAPSSSNPSDASSSNQNPPLQNPIDPQSPTVPSLGGGLPEFIDPLFLGYTLPGSRIPVSDLMRVKRPDQSTVYLIDEAGKRHAFLNEPLYFTWFSDFSGVLEIDGALLASFPEADPVPPRPGHVLIKWTDAPSVYQVFPSYILEFIDTEEIAASLFGSLWSDRILDLDTVFHGVYARVPAFTPSFSF